jgi:putative tRNA adenosine deaminase-associated protein
VSYTATALIRKGADWTAHDVDLSDVEDLDGAADVLRDFADDAALALLFVEEDDEYVGIVRVKGDDDPRIFVSDVRVLDTSTLAARIFADAIPVVVEDEIEEDEDGEPAEDSAKTDNEPGGDPALLSDLGTSADALLALCGAERMLPADVIFAVCESAGCVDVLDEVRGVV